MTKTTRIAIVVTSSPVPKGPTIFASAELLSRRHKPLYTVNPDTLKRLKRPKQVAQMLRYLAGCIDGSSDAAVKAALERVLPPTGEG